MAQDPQTLIRHEFLFGRSPDLGYDDAVTPDTGYIIRHAIEGKEQKPQFIHMTAMRYFCVDAPIGSVVTILLSARDSRGLTSKAIPFEFRVTGNRILRHPGQSEESLWMTGASEVSQAPQTFTDTEPQATCGDGCGQCNCEHPKTEPVDSPLIVP